MYDEAIHFHVVSGIEGAPSPSENLCVATIDDARTALLVGLASSAEGMPESDSEDVGMLMLQVICLPDDLLSQSAVYLNGHLHFVAIAPGGGCS